MDDDAHMIESQIYPAYLQLFLGKLEGLIYRGGAQTHEFYKGLTIGMLTKILNAEDDYNYRIVFWANFGKEKNKTMEEVYRKKIYQAWYRFANPSLLFRREYYPQIPQLE